MKNAEMAGARAEGRKRGRFEVVPHPSPPGCWNLGNGARGKWAGVGKTRADSRSRSRRRQSALSALFEKSAPTDVGGYDCSDSWIRPGARQSRGVQKRPGCQSGSAASGCSVLCRKRSHKSGAVSV